MNQIKQALINHEKHLERMQWDTHFDSNKHIYIPVLLVIVTLMILAGVICYCKYRQSIHRTFRHYIPPTGYPDAKAQPTTVDDTHIGDSTVIDTAQHATGIYPVLDIS